MSDKLDNNLQFILVWFTCCLIYRRNQQLSINYVDYSEDFQTHISHM